MFLIQTISSLFILRWPGTCGLHTSLRGSSALRTAATQWPQRWTSLITSTTPTGCSRCAELKFLVVCIS
jgi:hypothetical protein